MPEAFATALMLDESRVRCMFVSSVWRERRERGGSEEGARRERGGSEERARRERGGSEEGARRERGRACTKDGGKEGGRVL